MRRFKEYKKLDLPNIQREILDYWDKKEIFNLSLKFNKEDPSFVFYEGPPSANGSPGIHHVIARTIKDLFCRYKTLKGHHVKRKAGWDTHGLPVELSVESKLGITKEDIGKNISIEDYNKACREDVMKYKSQWEELTHQMGYWVDIENPYVTYDNKYIETVWWLLSELYRKKLLYKGHTIQPYSPKAGTGLSTHELNQPGCYKDVKDTSAIAQFKIIDNKKKNILFNDLYGELFFLAWTTTPWTLPSNTALAVGKKIKYVKVKTYNQYTFEPITVVLAEKLVDRYFIDKKNDINLSDYRKGDKKIPFEVSDSFSGEVLEGVHYEQLLPYKQPENGDAFKVISADFVTTEDGTGIVHIAPSFGLDDSIVARKNGIGSLTLVDLEGKFVPEVYDLAGQYVKDEYYDNNDEKPKYSVDVQIIINLKKSNRLFRSEKHEHSYPHCWRTDKPILYYPLDSWFVKTTDYRERMIELNRTINWKPASTGSGRFSNWLENLVDWNLSRSRFWGIPLPIWRTEDGGEELCVGSIHQLKEEIDKSIQAGFMHQNPLINFLDKDFSLENYNQFDLHRPSVDEIVLVSKSGRIMKRELDIIDVWFDSGAMPYAQLHYPFENKKLFSKNYPADFIAEGVDQTRGWFFTLHAISTMISDSVAYKNVVSNGLVLDKDGNKMSKRLGNAVDPFLTLSKYGSDACRWYMISNAQPWDNLKFDINGIQEVQRKFFGTLYNTYAFFALYANIDGFTYREEKIDVDKRSEMDRWIISELNTLIINVEESYESYEPTIASRLIQDFVINKLSNWYIRLNRRRFWKGDYNKDKISAYQTLYESLEKISIISSPIAPFYMDQLFNDLNVITNRKECISVHISSFPSVKTSEIDSDLEERIRLSQKITSIGLSLRKREKIRVRQPLQKILIPLLDKKIKSQVDSVEKILLSELNIKEIQFISNNDNILSKKVKPNFRTLGPKFGKKMRMIASVINSFSEEDIRKIERDGSFMINDEIIIDIDDVEITSADVEGWKIVTENGLTVGLDITISKDLEEEGLSREFVNKVQNLRKEKMFDVTDKIEIFVEKNDEIEKAFHNNLSYICEETLSKKLVFVNKMMENYDEVILIDSIINVVIKKI